MRSARLLLPSLMMPILISIPLVGQLAAESRKDRQSEQGGAVKQRRQEEMTHQTLEQRMELRQQRQEGPIPINPSEERVKEKAGPETGAGRFLGTAWQYCNRGEVARAIDIFTALLSDPATQWEAKYGLAMCAVRSTDAKKAIPLLEELIGRKLHLKDTVPALLTLLVEEKDYSKAAPYVQLLAGRERKRWEETIRAGMLLAALEQAKAAGHVEGVVELIRAHTDLLDRCRSSEVFVKAANGLVGINDQYAKETYARLLRACPQKWDIRLGILYALRSVLLPVDMLLELGREERRTDLEPAYRTQLTDIRVAVLRDQLAAASPEVPEVERLAEAILALRSEDTGALATLAWWAFNRAQYARAAESFTVLTQRFPEETDYTYGLANTLVKLQRVDEALALIEPMKARDARFAALETDILMGRILTVFHDGRYAEAERRLESLLARRPDHFDAKTLLAWSIYNQQRGRDALPLFLSLFQQQEDPIIANTVLDIYTTSSDEGRAAAFADTLALSDKGELNKVAGDFFFRNGLAARAAATYCDPATCYYNAGTRFAEVSLYYRHRSGTNGLSRLTDYIIPMGVSSALSPNSELGLSLTIHDLSSGDATLSKVLNNISHSVGAPINVPSNAFRGITHTFTTSESAITPEITLAKEGLERRYRLTVGATPLGGAVTPLPTFVAEIGAKEWNLGIHQSSVTDSILSYVGIHARVPSIPQVPVRLLPSDLEWGRVVKTGIEGEWRATRIAPYWLSLKGGYDFHYGRNVIDNHAYRGSIAVGQTLTAKRWNISPGLHFTVQHFAHSTNFFTPGHGGYFSPDTHYIGGPFVNVQTQQCDTFIVEGQFGMNYFSERSNGAAADPLRILKLPEQMRFSGSSSSGLGFAVNVKGQVLLGNHWAFGGIVEANKAADFTEVKAGVNLHYFFEPRSKLLRRDTIFR